MDDRRMDDRSLLDGVHVLELGQLIAAPLCALQLLDLGADVLKVEPPGGDAARTLPPFTADGESLFFHALNRGKRGAVLERDDAAGLRELLDWADVVVENAAGAWPVRPEDARPQLVWCAISARGAGRGGRAMDPSLQAEMGLISITGEAAGPPLRVPVPLIDITTALAATQAVLAALWRVERGGTGGLVDVALLDSAATLTAFAGAAALAGQPFSRMGSESPFAVPSAVFATRDGHVQVVGLTDRQWRAICTALRLPADERLATAEGRLAHRARVNRLIADAVATLTAGDAAAAIAFHGGLAEPVRSIEDAWRDPALRERGLLGRLGDLPLPTLSLTRARGAELEFHAGPGLGS